MENKDFYDTGFELESYKFDLKKARDLLNANGIIINRNVCLDYSKYNVMTEEHISYDDYNSRHYSIYGGEVISPIIHDRKALLKSLKEVVEVVKSTGGDIIANSCAGFHIHVSNEALSTKELLNRYLKFNYVYSGPIYEQAKGDMDSLRDSILMYASPIRKEFVKRFIESKDLELIRNKLSHKNHYVRLSKNTIEDRRYNATLNLDILERYYDFVIRMYNYINTLYDEEEIDYLFDKTYDSCLMNFDKSLGADLSYKLDKVRGLY